MKGIEQGRAKFAYKCATKGAALKSSKEYKSYVKKIPTYIKTNGLGAALAFVFSKKKDNKAYGLLYSQIEEWLKIHCSHLIDLTDQKSELMEKVIELNSGEYRALTSEVLALFNWIRRFAEGLIEKEGE